MTEKMDKEVEFMCNLSESVLKEGEIKSAIEHTKNLMKNCNVDINKALEILELPKDIRQIVIEELKKE